MIFDLTAVGTIQFWSSTTQTLFDFLDGATTLDQFLKAYKSSQMKALFPYEWFDNPGLLVLPLYHCMKPFSVNNINPLDKDFIIYEKLRKRRAWWATSTEKILNEYVPISGLDSYNYLQGTRQKKGVTVLKVFLQ